MTWAEETAGASPLRAHLVWPSAEDEEVEYWEDGAPAVRGFFLGQLRDDQSDGVWEDEQPGWDNRGDRPADASDFEGFDLPGWTGSADLDQAPDDEAPHAYPVATLDPELGAPATSLADDDEWPLASATDDPTSVDTRPVPLAGGRETGGVASEQRGRHRRSRVGIVVAAVVALVIGTAVYVGQREKAEDQPGRRPASTSLERQPAATTGTTTTTAGSPDAAPDTEPTPVSNAPGSGAPASRQGAPSGAGSTQTRAPTGTAGATSPPPSAGSGPNASPPSPPASPPNTTPNPICQITPDLCP